MADLQTEIYTIFCVTVGENNVFPIEIKSSKTVGTLKKMIKEEKKNRFANIDADSLELYHVEIPDDEHLAKAVNQRFNTEPVLKALRATEELSSLFPETPAKKTVHILVQTPEISK
jgi:Crinkler effector protein N-terminal domain